MSALRHPNEISGNEGMGLRLIVLAQNCRPGRDTLSERFGVRHRSLVPLAGRPLIGYVLQTATCHPLVESLAVSIESDAFDAVYDELTRLPGRGAVRLVQARRSFAESVRAAAEDWDGPIIVTTADHVLLSPSSIDAMASRLRRSEVALALVRSDPAAATAWPGVPIQLSDGAFRACRLYGVSSAKALGAVNLIRDPTTTGDGLWSFRSLGVIDRVLAQLRLLTLGDCLRHFARRLHLRVEAVELDDQAQAFDVDDEASLDQAADLLAARQTSGEQPAEVSGRTLRVMA